MEFFAGNKKLSLSSPALMGILNVTPDSFYDGGNYMTEKKILRQAEKMLEEGAAILDLGGYSTRPGARHISGQEETARLIPAIKAVRKKFPGAMLSADTFRSSVAIKAVQEGADMVNDISGGTMDKKMFETVAQLNCGYVLTHLLGTPQTMQKNPRYADVVKEVKNFFMERITFLKKVGVAGIMIDPGFGFGKTLEHNYQLLNHLAAFQSFGLPILAGISRKSMINKVLGTLPRNALNGTTAVHMLALVNGANILRVHDVKEAKEAVKIFTFARQHA
jgi:dihydropteroate synthase